MTEADPFARLAELSEQRGPGEAAAPGSVRIAALETALHGLVARVQRAGATLTRPDQALWEAREALRGGGR